MQTVLVTGGAGFLGSHLCERLLSEGYDVISVDNLSTGSRKNIASLLSHKQFHYLEYNVSEPLPGDLHADAVFHLASPASPNHHSNISYHALPMETMTVNTEGTKHLLEFCVREKASFLFASSSEAYGDPLEHPQKETYHGNVSTTGPRSVYDEAKRFGETITAYYARDRGVDARIVRLFNTYGPNMNIADMRMVISFISQALKNEPITIFGNGKQTRSLCYVDDTIDGLMKLMFTPGLSGQIVNIGSSDEHTVLEYAEIIKKLTDSASEIVLSESLPVDDPLRRRADTSKAQKLLNWRTKVSLEEGLGNVIEYVRKESTYDHYSNNPNI